MSNKIGAKIVLEGEEKYRRALKGINTEQKELRSEMKLVSTQFANQQNSIEALTKKNEILTKQYGSQKEKIDVYKEAIKNASKNEKEAGENVEKLKTAYDLARKEMEEMAESSDTSKEALEEQEKVVKELEKELALAEQSYSTAQNATNDWQTSLNNARTVLVNMENELAENKKHLAEAEKSTDDTAQSIDEYGREVDNAKDKTQTFGDVLKANLASDIIEKSVEALVNSIKKIATASVEVGKNFESGMSQVAATMGITSAEISAGSKDFEMLSKAAQDAGKSTQFSASQSAEALNYLALAGYDATKACETLPSVLNLAAAGGLDLAYASDLVTDSMAALGLSTEELDKYVDEMAKTSQKSNTSVAQLGEATLTCAGSVSLTGQSLETMNAELGVLANNGLKGAEGGTHLRNVLLSLIAPTDKGAAALKTLGVSVNDNSGNMRDLNSIMTDLNKSMANMSSSERTNFINRIFNKTDIGAVNALLKGTGQEFDNLKGELTKCEGAAANMATTMNDNLAGKVTILQSALEGLGISAYEKIEGTLKESVDAATESVGNLQVAMDSGELGRAMDDFSDALGDAAKGAVEFAEDALPVMIDGLTWVLDNSELVTAGIAGITAAEIAHGAVVPLILATMEAWEKYKLKVEEATVAQFAFNQLQTASGIGLAITALAGLIAAVSTYAIASKDATTKEEEFAKATEDTIKKLQNNEEKRKEATENQKAEATTIRKLKDELIGLTSEEELSTEKKEKMAGIISELNQLVPDLNLYYDEEKHELSMTNDELERYIDNSLKSAEISLMKDQLTEKARDCAAAEMELTKAIQENEDALKAAEENQRRWTEAQEEGHDALKALEQELGMSCNEAFEYYGKNIAATEDAMNTAKTAVENLETEYANLSEQCDKTTEAFEKEKAAQDELLKTQINYKDKVYEVSASVASNMEVIQQSYDEAFEKAKESIEGQVGLFEELKMKSDLTTTQMAANLSSQKDFYNQYSDDIQKANELLINDNNGSFNAVLSEIMELGIDGAGYLHELVSAAETDTDEFNKVMTEWAEMNEARTNLESTMADITTGYSDHMEKLLGIQKDDDTKMKDEDKTTHDDIQKQTEDALDELVSTTGEGIDNMVSAVNEKAPEVKTASEELCSAALDGCNESLQIDSAGRAQSFVSIGYSIPEGIAQGITENKDVIKRALKSALDDAVATADLSGLLEKINVGLGEMMS